MCVSCIRVMCVLVDVFLPGGELANLEMHRSLSDTDVHGMYHASILDVAYVIRSMFCVRRYSSTRASTMSSSSSRDGQKAASVSASLFSHPTTYGIATSASDPTMILTQAIDEEASSRDYDLLQAIMELPDVHTNMKQPMQVHRHRGQRTENTQGNRQGTLHCIVQQSTRDAITLL